MAIHEINVEVIELTTLHSLSVGLPVCLPVCLPALLSACHAFDPFPAVCRNDSFQQTEKIKPFSKRTVSRLDDTSSLGDSIIVVWVVGPTTTITLSLVDQRWRERREGKGWSTSWRRDQSKRFLVPLFHHPHSVLRAPNEEGSVLHCTTPCFGKKKRFPPTAFFLNHTKRFNKQTNKQTKNTKSSWKM